MRFVADELDRRARDKETKQALQASVRAVLFWKYALIFLAFCFAFFVVTYNFHTGIFAFVSVKSDLLSGVVASFIIAIIYDLFTKREEQVISQLDRSTLVNELSRELFLARGVADLSDTDIGEIAAALVQDDRFLTSLARISAVDSIFADDVLHSYLRPLWRAPLVHFYSWDNRLVPKATGDEPLMYTWKSYQRFSVYSELPVFLTAITDDAFIGSTLINSAVFFNNVIVMGGYVKKDVEANLSNDLSLAVERRIEGRRMLLPIHPKIMKMDEVFTDPNVLEQYKKFEHLVTLVEFDVRKYSQTGSPRAIFEFSFSAQISYFEPFFYVQAENISFVETITVDYHDIAHRLKKVWVTNFIGNAGCEIEHNVTEKTVKCQVDGIVMAGQGFLLTWLPEVIPAALIPKSSAASSAVAGAEHMDEQI